MDSKQGSCSIDLLRQNYSSQAEDAINKQINRQLGVMYTYLSMSAYCSRSDVVLKGFSKFLSKKSQTLYEQAHLLMKFQNQRGGTIVFKDISKPAKNYTTIEEIILAAVDIERDLYESYMDLHEIACQPYNSDKGCDLHGKPLKRCKDPHMDEFVEDYFLAGAPQQVKDVVMKITNIYRVQDTTSKGTEHGIFHMDAELKK